MIQLLYLLNIIKYSYNILCYAIKDLREQQIDQKSSPPIHEK